MSAPNKAWSSISTELVHNPDNLQLWQDLVKEAESNNKKGINKSTPPEEIQLLRTTYQNILDKYPLLFKYWIKYASWEFKLGHIDRAEAIYRSSMVHLSYCIDLWVTYLQFKIDTNHNKDEILTLFETARRKIGYHFHSYEFYDLYLSFLKNCKNESNGFHLKYHVLLRIIIELPIYHYEHFFKKIMSILASLNGADLHLMIPQKELSSIRNPKNAVNQLKKMFIDVYITTQYKVYELFKFERKLTKPYFDLNYISRQQLEAWNSYLNFLQSRDYPRDYVIFNFERCLLATALYSDFWTKYANFEINDGNLERAVEILSRGFSMNGDYQLLIELVDLHIYMKQWIRARDLILAYVKNTVSVPIPIYEKLIQLERIINPRDDAYLIKIFKELILETNQDWWFNQLLLFDVNNEQKLELFNEFKERFEDSPIFKSSLRRLKRLMGVIDTEQLRDFDEELNGYL
ncbi:uncharacterized protein CANTADRAFT_25721 [Suhomyces tanzawaensis NRRL Y-17324]|uniref:Pre-mRNA-processing factor 39 n=1 Tax=Suhomyces tanzawaensis NRRL Y-17324 TaxID=984487 RepID=A0A1E4SK95_9ASCO|nr:uncharacterized protein CANTADRAFT_25721 [Suhomyces tanzawaensis NRRL Y-17324]ODV79929.1 hypothetical protein CANTADRAFT_25721 [Suhomyces tanzawaensis NRRL Y-17324]